MAFIDVLGNLNNDGTFKNRKQPSKSELKRIMKEAEQAWYRARWNSINPDIDLAVDRAHSRYRDAKEAYESK